MKQKQNSTHIGNHSCWAKKTDADRQANLRNKYHNDYEYWVEAVDRKLFTSTAYRQNYMVCIDNNSYMNVL